MRVGIAGFSGSGKSTVFHWLTGVAPDPSRSQQGQVGKPAIPDPRLDWLSAHFKPKKTTPAQLEFLDTPGLLATERRDNPRRLNIMRDAGALLVVLGGYTGGDLADELRRFREELLFADLEIVSTRADKLREKLKKPRPAKERDADQAELDILTRVVTAMEKGLGAAAAGLKGDEEKLIRSFQLLTLKPELVMVNVGDDRIGQPLPADLLVHAPSAIQAPAKLERELEELSDEDREMFMADLKIGGFSRDKELRSIFYGMGQIVFFTVGEDECRAWPMPRGYTSQEGAGEIHTDLAKGFVRAEVVSYADFQKHGSMKEAKTHGVYRLESKTYVVQDGDIMHILAST
jgi:ribosome-binding ATPase YchF (GTP1/OBG family)